MEKIDKILLYILRVFAIVFICLGGKYFIDSLKASNKPEGIIYGVAFYALIMFAILFFKANDKNVVYKFTDVTKFSFWFWVLLLPLIIICMLTLIYVYFGDVVFAVPTQVMSKIGIQTNRDTFLVICSIVQVISIAIWFLPKVLDKNLGEPELMELDYYSTVAIIPLTAVWVIYNLDNVKYGFALILCVFMIIQVLIKKAQIPIKQQKTCEDKRKILK